VSAAKLKPAAPFLALQYQSSTIDQARFRAKVVFSSQRCRDATQCLNKLLLLD
jgi:hypothetical protein